MPEVVFSSDSKADLKNIVRNFTKKTWGNEKAVEYVAGLRQHAKNLSEVPEIGKNRDAIEEGLLSFPYASHIIFYMVESHGITVSRVLHKSQDPFSHIRRTGWRYAD